MDVKRHASFKGTVRVVRKRKLSTTTECDDSQDSKVQRLEDTSSKARRGRSTCNFKRRTTIGGAEISLPANDVRFQETVAWDIFTPGDGIHDKRFSRFCNPLPTFQWSDSFETWTVMVSRENKEIYKRNEKLFMRHPGIQPRMRAILIDWLNEVCEVYKIQRRSFYMAIDYLDRYLSRVDNVQKKSLQLIGVTALFIASKAEEIYPPKLTDFSFITDGACTASDILKKELEMLQVLQWQLTTVTPVCWAACFLQIMSCSSKTEFLETQFEQNKFVKVCRLLDLCILNSESIRFSYYLLAASAVSFFIKNKTLLSKATVLSAEQLNECKEWMQPYFKVLSSDASVICNSFPNISQQSAHNIQTHVVNLNTLDAVQETSFSQSGMNTEASNSPIEKTLKQSCDVDGLPTPPKSTEVKQKSIQMMTSVDQEEISVKHINLNSN